jgi:hypothetical protein
LYFISGADLFDGLTWLRYAFINGNTSYIHHASPMAGVLDSSEELLHKTIVNNHYYLVGMKDEFTQFILTNGDFSSFKHHAEMFESSYNLLLTAQVGE